MKGALCESGSSDNRLDGILAGQQPVSVETEWQIKARLWMEQKAAAEAAERAQAEEAQRRQEQERAEKGEANVVSYNPENRGLCFLGKGDISLCGSACRSLQVLQTPFLRVVLSLCRKGVGQDLRWRTAVGDHHD